MPVGQPSYCPSRSLSKVIGYLTLSSLVTVAWGSRYDRLNSCELSVNDIATTLGFEMPATSDERNKEMMTSVRPCVLYVTSIACGLLAGPAFAQTLKPGEYFITQSWSQEKAFRRPYHVSVPKPNEVNRTDQQELPVFIFLHGNGGNARQAMRGFMRNHKQMAARYVLVFAQGYRESWNIVSERSKADDRGFIEAIVLKLATFDNVDPNNFTIMGTSNGAALVNQLAIESKLPNIRNYISGVSPLNVWQHDGENFKAKGDDNNYRDVATPMAGKRLLNISGTNDRLVPYRGGPSRAIPAKDGKLAFVAAEHSTFLWAKQMGYEGEKLSRPTKTDGRLEVVSYLDGDVVHYKVSGEGHGATRAVSEQLLLEFIEGRDADRRN